MPHDYLPDTLNEVVLPDTSNEVVLPDTLNDLVTINPPVIITTGSTTPAVQPTGAGVSVKLPNTIAPTVVEAMQLAGAGVINTSPT
jgi:hypothetical protein